ncbi:Putative integral membrane protein [Corynebacterium glyciniphilum AJ 3170]|uniref:Putative integral membrane protein n=1 Tax=Corynebacterium glyciniphilum AJ 3170 TaxID=1404245 RepID=X5E689_9CORY|nr:hypothetical protein [Corynebacterium glyciniphilum]AHW62965.1 Putative integral membrane protein [Corynebacterium glyciniphilum AJ 3170]
MNTSVSAGPGTSRATGTNIPLTTAVVAAVVTVVTGAVQFIVMAVWGARGGLSLREVLMQWDAHWMTMISEYGYSGFVMSPDQTDPVQWESVAFFPGYPVLVRVVAAPMAVLDVADATYVAALVVSAVATVVLAWGVSMLAVELWRRRGSNPGAGGPSDRRTVVVLSTAVTVLAVGAPMGIVYWMPYSESLFTAVTVWALYFLLRRRFLPAGVLTMVAGATRVTATALILTLCVAAIVELWRWWRNRRTAHKQPVGAFPAAAVSAPVIGSLGIAAYLAWADSKVADIGGYFAAQERGWHSGVDLGAATLRWLAGNFPGELTGYTISSWSMILVALLCAVSVWMLWSGRIPWQVWLPAIILAGIVLGSDGIMHSRPRLLLVPVLLLALPLVVELVRMWRTATRSQTTVMAGVALGAGAVLWCVLGFWVSGEMLIVFEYAI